MAFSPRRLEAAMSAYMRLRQEGVEQGWWPQDNEDQLAVIESETDILEILDGYTERVIQQELLAEKARARAKRLEETADRERRIIREIVGVIGEKVVRPLYTASTRQSQELVEVPTNEELPAAFVREAPDRVLIAKTLRHGGEVPGYALQDKNELVLTLRTA